MPTQRDLRNVIGAALVRWSKDMVAHPRLSNPKKSDKWLKCLANQFGGYLARKTNIKVFSIPYQDKKNITFKSKLKEYLFDIHVCETSRYRSRRKKKNPYIPIVSKSLIAVESEFSTDTHEAAVDLCKLICSNSDTKIFIGPNKVRRSSINQIYFPAIEDIAQHNETGSLYVALIPTPQEISSGFKSWRLYKLHNKKLRKIFSSDE